MQKYAVVWEYSMCAVCWKWFRFAVVYCFLFGSYSMCVAGCWPRFVVSDLAGWLAGWLAGSDLTGWLVT